VTRHSQRHRSTTLPFEYRDSGLDFELKTYSIDGGERVDIDLLPGQTEIDLASVLEPEEEDEVGDWKTVSLEGQLHVPDETVGTAFPPEERSEPPVKLYIAVRCHETIYRDQASVSEAPTDSGTHEVEVTLRKENIRGTVELHPYLVRTEDRSEEGKYASQSNFRVASGRSYTVVVDRPDDERPPAIDGEEVSFSQASHLPGGEKLYYLDFRNESQPKLWINSDHPRITDILQSRGSIGAEARMRDVILDQISYGVWTQLLIRAGSAIDEDGEVEHEWQKTVLETFARNLYDVSDLSEATHKLRTDLNDPETLPHLVERIDRELQEYIDPRTQLINLMEEGLSI